MARIPVGPIDYLMTWRAGVVLLLLCASSAQAHHSLAGMYDQSRQVTLDGVLTQFVFVNPHPFVMMEVRNARGETESWKAEMDNRGELAGIGMSGTTLKAGDHVIVSGNPGWKLPNMLYVRSLQRPADRFLYEQVGTSPRVSTLPR